MICTILAALDSSPCGRSAGSYAAHLGVHLNAAVHALTVLDIRPLEGPMLRDFTTHLGLEPFETYTQALRDVLQQRADEVLADFEQDARAQGLPDDRFRAVSEVGIVAETICRNASDTDLVLIGQFGENPSSGGGLLGSTSEQIVRRSSRPVMVCPDSFRPIKNPIVAYDGSELANTALHLAAAFSAQIETGLTVLVVADDDSIDEQGAQEIAARAARYLDRASIEHKLETAHGKPEEIVVSHAESGRYDLFVMGALAHSRIRELIVGSVTAHVMRNSPIPVMLTR